MSSQIPTTTIAHEQASLPNQPFFSWVRNHTTLFISQIAAILGSISLPASTIYYVRKGAGENSQIDEFLKPESVAVLVDYAHVLFIVIALVALIRVLNDNERGSYRVGLVYTRVFEDKLPDDYYKRLDTSKRKLGEFKKYFLWFWLAMFCLYVSFAFQHTYNLATTTKNKTASTSQSYAESENSKRPWIEASRPLEHPLSGFDLATSLGFAFLTFVLNNVSILFVFWCYTVLYVPLDDAESKKKHRRFLRRSFYVIVGLTALFPLILWFGNPGLNAFDRRSYVAIFDALSGTLNAIIFALLIARLDSKLIGLRSWLICILYSYAAVQPLFVVFGQETEVFKRIATSVLIFVFVSKIYFFLIIIYALQTGRMLNYLFCFPSLSKQVDKANPRDGAQTGSELWLLERRRPRVADLCRALGILALLCFFGSLITYAGALGGVNKFYHLLEREDLVSDISSYINIDNVQLAFVSLAIVVLWLGRKDKDPRTKADRISKKIFPRSARSPTKNLSNRATDQLKRFKNYFLWFWIVTLPLYVLLKLKHRGFGPDLDHDPRDFWEVVKVLWNPFLTFTVSTVNLMFIFWCFVVLQSPVYDLRSKTTDKSDPNDSEAKQKVLIDFSEARQKLLIHYSAFVVVLLIAAFFLLLFPAGGMKFNQKNLKDYATVFEGVTGVLSAVALSLLIARLDSKLINLSPLLIYLLFFYAAIQPLFVVFEQEGPVFRIIENAVLTSALLLKICFFLITLQALHDGSLLTYLVGFPFLQKRVDSIFDNQFEIRISREAAKSFSISIWKKNHLVYIPGANLKSRSRCDLRIERLQEVMKDSDNYEFSRASGTHWLRIVDRKETGELMCESIALRSREDAEHLREESIEKIPYCKYDRS